MNVVYDLCLLEGCHYLGSTDIISLAVTPVALSNQLIITLPHYSFAPRDGFALSLPAGSIPLDPRSRCHPPCHLPIVTLTSTL